MKEGFILRKRNVFVVKRRKKEVYEFIDEQLRKEYIRPLKQY